MNGTTDVTEQMDMHVWQYSLRAMDAYKCMKYEEPCPVIGNQPIREAGWQDCTKEAEESGEDLLSIGMVAAYRLAGVI